MFTRNFFKILNALAGDISSSSITATLKDSANNDTICTVNSLSTSIKCIGGIGLGNTYTSGRAANGGSLYFLSNGTTIYCGSTISGLPALYNGVILGDSDTAPSIDDLDIKGNLITDFSATTAVNISMVDNAIKVIATYTITNTGISNITIKEYAARVPNQGPTAYCVFNRGIFSEPITIEPGETKIISIEIGFQN